MMQLGQSLGPFFCFTTGNLFIWLFFLRPQILHWSGGNGGSVWAPQLPHQDVRQLAACSLHCLHLDPHETLCSLAQALVQACQGYY